MKKLMVCDNKSCRKDAEHATANGEKGHSLPMFQDRKCGQRIAQIGRNSNSKFDCVSGSRAGNRRNLAFLAS